MDSSATDDRGGDRLRVIIACAGEAKRWAEHLGVPKHLAATADGEVLLERTISQALALSSDVHVTTPDDDRYADHIDPRATRHVCEPAAAGGEYSSTRHLWSDTGRTVLLLGDVYFTDRCIATIGAGSPTAYRVFGRYRASKLTGTPYGEIFAASWGAERLPVMDLHLTAVEQLRRTGVSNRPPGWLLLRLWQGTPVGKHVVQRPIWVEVDDWTDDLDVPADYQRHPAFGGSRARV